MQQQHITYGPVKPFLPDSLQQGIPPYADINTKPSDSLLAKIDFNPFFQTAENIPIPVLKKHKSISYRKINFSGSHDCILLQVRPPSAMTPNLVGSLLFY